MLSLTQNYDFNERSRLALMHLENFLDPLEVVAELAKARTVLQVS